MLEINDIDFLNFFYPIDIILYDIKYKSAGHFYFASKFNILNHTKNIAISDNPEEESIELLTKHPDLLRNDWNDVKNSILSYSIYSKFLNPELQRKLICTGNEELIFIIDNLKEPSEDMIFLGYNTITKIGDNALGKELMNNREIFKGYSKHSSFNRTYQMSPEQQCGCNRES